MRIWLLIIMVTISSVVYSQGSHDPFVGGVEFGLGYGTVIDFNLDNNNFYREYLLERLIWLPFQIGFVTAKYLNPNKYLEFGVIFARRSSTYVYRHNYSSVSIYGTSLPTLTIFSIDLPIKYYAYVGKMLNQQMYAYGGIIPSWVIRPGIGSDYNDIPEDCFRNVYVSVCGGLCYDKKKSRMKLQAGLAVTSVVNSNYRDIPQEDRGYGGRIYPFELLFCYARMFR